MHKLTARQVTVLADAMQGRIARESALRLHLSVSTVKSHRARILSALGAATIAHAMAIFLRDVEMGQPAHNGGDEAVSA